MIEESYYDIIIIPNYSTQNQIKSKHLFYTWIVSSQSWYAHVNTRLKTN